MKTHNNIGLDTEKCKELAQALNDLLANYTVFYQNLRGFHWNIQGEKFFELHVKFEELYNDFFEKIDEVAERILTLGHAPQHKSSDYLKKAQISESNEVSNGTKAIKEILDGFTILLKKERHILNLSSEIDDEGTNAQMSDYIREQEKMVWMYSAYLN
ncbi:MAG: DNA starvation/stationary phase protection protein [Bacteroidetes bacterium]|nr:DNA starvation/stationary phase protection protein [Bacteroidota bacterium]